MPGATLLHYDVRGELRGAGATVLILAGSPIDARGFTTLATHFTDRTVITYDPRGVERSIRTDGSTQSTPDQHADDLRRLIEALDAGPVDLFAVQGRGRRLFPDGLQIPQLRLLEATTFDSGITLQRYAPA